MTSVKKSHFMNDFWNKKYSVPPTKKKLCAVVNEMNIAGISTFRFPMNSKNVNAMINWFSDNYSKYNVLLESLYMKRLI